MNVTAYDIAQRFIGIKEVPGSEHNPVILSMLRLDQAWPEGDEVPWCSGFVNYVAWLLRLPRSKSLAARSWLKVGIPVGIEEARPGFDIVILNRGGSTDPDVSGPGHVGFFSRLDGIRGEVYLLGGNQSNGVSVARFPADRLLGVRRLA